MIRKQRLIRETELVRSLTLMVDFPFRLRNQRLRDEINECFDQLVNNPIEKIALQEKFWIEQQVTQINLENEGAETLVDSFFVVSD